MYRVNVNLKKKAESVTLVSFKKSPVGKGSSLHSTSLHFLLLLLMPSYRRRLTPVCLRFRCDLILPSSCWTFLPHRRHLQGGGGTKEEGSVHPNQCWVPTGLLL